MTQIKRICFQKKFEIVKTLQQNIYAIEVLVVVMVVMVAMRVVVCGVGRYHHGNLQHNKNHYDQHHPSLDHNHHQYRHHHDYHHHHHQRHHQSHHHHH